MQEHGSESSRTEQAIDHSAPAGLIADRVEPIAPSAAAADANGSKSKDWSLFHPADKEIMAMFLPSVANIMLVPLSGAVDLMWVGRMDSSIAIAGQSAGMQVNNFEAICSPAISCSESSPSPPFASLRD